MVYQVIEIYNEQPM